MKLTFKITSLALLATLIGCTTDAYESGDGVLSDMRADFVEAQTDGTAAIVTITTDDGVSLPLTQAYKPDGVEVADTTYRMLAYYEMANDSQGATEAHLMGLQSVIVPSVQATSEFKEGVKTDPVTFNSAWISASQRYLNIDFSVKTGTLDNSDVIQLVGMAVDYISQYDNGHRTFSLRLYHNQGNAPEYYSSQHYLSVPLYRGVTTVNTGDTVRLNLQSYSGLVSKSFIIE